MTKNNTSAMANEGGVERSGWPEIRGRYLKLMADCELRLKSGNSIPVERTHITSAEFALMGEYEDACEDLSNQQAAAIAALQAQNESLAARCERLQEIADTFLPVMEAARPLVLNLERLRDAATEAK